VKTLHLVAALAAALLLAESAFAQATPRPRRNAIIFVADGMRHSAVSDENTPTMTRLRREGVNFVNSHSLYPTFTMPNASAIATGHLLGDTGQFGNTLYLGFPSTSGSMAIGTENDSTLQFICDHFDNKNYLNETSLLAAARSAGFHTAAIGKHGPALLQDVTQHRAGTEPLTVILDDIAGTRDGVRLPAKVLAAARRAGIERVTPPATRVPNVPQQEFVLEFTLKAILPTFLEEKEKPFVLVYWSRDPDHAQHNQADNRNPDTRLFDRLGVGINGPSAQAAWRNADRNLAGILEFLAATDDPASPGQKLAATTNVFVTSDHGFGTVSRRDLSASGDKVDNFASTIHYQHLVTVRNVPTAVEAEIPGFLPAGFVGIDLAEHLKLPAWDLNTISRPKTPSTAPGATDADRTGIVQYARVDPKQPPEGTVRRMYAASGHCLLGGTGRMTYHTDANGLVQGRLDPDARLITFANGGSEAIYFPNAKIENGRASASDVALAREVIGYLSKQKYVGALFVDADVYGPMPGALSLADIGLKGSAQTPVPAIIVSFATFSMDPANPLYTGVEIADTGLDHSQGIHGTFARFDTFNNMIAIGPDFKKGLRDSDPVSNADIAPTLAATLGIELPSKGKLKGRIIEEALANGRAPVGAAPQLLSAEPTPEGFRTDLRLQTLKDSAGQDYTYRTWAGTKGRVVTGE
jgi:arylsulfatase A-like enzyme